MTPIGPRMRRAWEERRWTAFDAVRVIADAESRRNAEISRPLTARIAWTTNDP
jgi:hypothetical protein